MKKLRTLIFAAAVALPFSASADVIEPYIGGSLAGGNSYYTGGLESHNYTALGLQAGVRIPFIGIEVEYNRWLASEVSAGIGMLNFYLEPFPFLPVVSPYVGFGVGRVFDSKIEGIKLATNNAVQGMLGMGVTIPGFPVRFDAELRGLVSGDLNPETEVLNRPVVMGSVEGRLKAAYVF